MANALIRWLSHRLEGLSKEVTYAFWAPLVALGLVFIWNLTPLAQRLELLSVDLRFAARAPYDPPPDPRLMYVGIDQPTLDDLGAWPWPRTVEADFLNLIAHSGKNPSVVAFDVLLTDDYDKGHILKLQSGKSFDQLLGDAASLLPCVISGAFYLRNATDPAEQAAREKQTQKDLGNLYQTSPYTHIQGDVNNITGSNVAKFPVDDLRKQSFFGFVNVEPSQIDGIRHVVPLLIRVRDQVFPSLSLQILCQMLNVDAEKVHIVLGQSIVLSGPSGKSWTIPINKKGEVAINYRDYRWTSSDQGVSFHKLFSELYRHDNNNEPLPPACDVDKKTMLIGGAAIGLEDLGSTPFGVSVPLCYTHLNIINNVLRQDYLAFVPRHWVVIGWLLLTWAMLFSLRTATIVQAVTVPFLIVAFYTATATALFGLWSIQIEMVWPILTFAGVSFGAVILRWRESLEGREQIKKVFAQMVSPDLMNFLVDHPENLNLGGSTRAVTILFSDIRSFTTLSESTEEQELVRQLNHYFDYMVTCIMDYRGTLHGFTGDGIMAVWGDVSPASSGMQRDALNAVHSARNMQRKLIELNQERALENLAPLRIGIGLNHGEVVVGQLGVPKFRTQFSVIGDTVNTTSRIEGVTKEFGIELAIGENLRALIGDEFIVRRLGKIQLKGKKKAILAYEVLTESAHPDESSWKPEELAQYEASFDHFMGRQFPEAIAGFESCLNHHPEDFAVDHYYKLSLKYNNKSLPENWDGRLVMSTK